MTTFSPCSEVPGLRRHPRRSFWRRICRAPFFVGCLIGAMSVVGLPRAATAETAVGLTMATAETAVGLTAAPSTTQDLRTYLPVFWQRAFGLAFDPNNSGLVLTEVAPATNLWQVDVGDKSLPIGQQIVGTGSFAEAYRAEISELAVSQEMLAQAGLAEFKHFAASGFFTGSTAFARHTYGLLLRVGMNPAQPGAVGLTFVAFVPFGDMSDAAGAQAAAAALRASFQEQVPPAQLQAGAADPGNCRAIRDLCYDAAKFRALV